jgi:hypothetical protein
MAPSILLALLLHISIAATALALPIPSTFSPQQHLQIPLISPPSAPPPLPSTSAVEALDTTPVFPEANNSDHDADDLPHIVWRIPGPGGKPILSPVTVCRFEAGVLNPFDCEMVDDDVPAFTGRPAAECAYLEKLGMH